MTLDHQIASIHTFVELSYFPRTVQTFREQEYWKRSEYQKRGLRHIHGLFKAATKYDLCDEATRALKGHVAQLQLDYAANHPGYKLPMPREKLDEAIENGRTASTRVVNTVRALSCAWVVGLGEGVWVKPKKAFCSLVKDPRRHTDPAELAALIKGHQLWAHPHNIPCSAYCKRFTEKGEEYCRFGFPKNDPPLPTACQLVFERLTDKSGKPLGTVGLLVLLQKEPYLKYCSSTHAALRVHLV